MRAMRCVSRARKQHLFPVGAAGGFFAGSARARRGRSLARSAVLSLIVLVRAREDSERASGDPRAFWSSPRGRAYRADHDGKCPGHRRARNRRLPGGCSRRRVGSARLGSRVPVAEGVAYDLRVDGPDGDPGRSRSGRMNV